MTHDVENYDEIFSGTREVAENLKIDAKKLQPWIDANVPDAGQIEVMQEIIDLYRNYRIPFVHFFSRQGPVLNM